MERAFFLGSELPGIPGGIMKKWQDDDTFFLLKWSN